MCDSTEKWDDDAHLARRQVLLAGEIDDETANDVIAKMLYLQFVDLAAPMTLLIDSPGGSVANGVALHAQRQGSLHVACHECTAAVDTPPNASARGIGSLRRLELTKNMCHEPRQIVLAV